MQEKEKKAGTPRGCRGLIFTRLWSGEWVKKRGESEFDRNQATQIGGEKKRTFQAPK